MSHQKKFMSDATDEPMIYCLDCEMVTPCECECGPSVVSFHPPGKRRMTATTDGSADGYPGREHT
jgi:hypothetical protein